MMAPTIDANGLPVVTKIEEIKIVGHDTSTFSGKPYTRFRTQLTTSRGKTEHLIRYSDFRGLYSRILKAFPNADKYGFPPKPWNLFNNNLSAEFVRERRAQLCMFFTKVTANQAILQHWTVREFFCGLTGGLPVKDFENESGNGGPQSSTTVTGGDATPGPFGRGGTVVGFTYSKWDPVRVAFERNFSSNYEHGAQLVIFEGNTVMVDLTGSCPKQPRYTASSVQPIFGAGETMEATVVALLVDRGLLSYSDLVSKHWPEFGVNGKEEVTVADVMRHEAGIPFFGVDAADLDDPMKYRSLTIEEAADRDVLDEVVANAPYFTARVATTVAGQLAAEAEGRAGGGAATTAAAGSAESLAEEGLADLNGGGGSSPGAANPRVPHTLTKGMIIDGIVRRVDPQGRGYGTFLSSEVGAALGLAACCGLTEEEQYDHKYADVKSTPAAFSMTAGIGARLLGSVAVKEAIKYKNDKLLNPGNRQVLDVVVPDPTAPTYDWANTKDARSLGLGACFTQSNARSVASLNATLANNGTMYVGGPSLFSPETCAGMLANLKAGGFGAGTEVALSQAGIAAIGSYAGVLVPERMSSLSGWYGTTGLGGSLSMWHPEKKLSFAYIVSGMAVQSPGGDTCSRLVDAMLAVIHTAEAAEAEAEQGGGGDSGGSGDTYNDAVPTPDAAPDAVADAVAVAVADADADADGSVDGGAGAGAGAAAGGEA